MADAVDRVVHNGDKGVKEDDDSEDKVEREQNHSNISWQGWVCSAAKLFDSTGVKNIPEQKLENRIHTIELKILVTYFIKFCKKINVLPHVPVHILYDLVCVS